MNFKMPDVTPHLAFPDNSEYVKAATQYWEALHKAWAKDVEDIHKRIAKEFFTNTKGKDV